MNSHASQTAKRYLAYRRFISNLARQLAAPMLRQQVAVARVPLRARNGGLVEAVDQLQAMLSR